MKNSSHSRYPRLEAITDPESKLVIDRPGPLMIVHCSSNSLAEKVCDVADFLQDGEVGSERSARLAMDAIEDLQESLGAVPPATMERLRELYREAWQDGPPAAPVPWKAYPDELSLARAAFDSNARKCCVTRVEIPPIPELGSKE
jgi:hypothetical protein